MMIDIEQAVRFQRYAVDAYRETSWCRDNQRWDWGIGHQNDQAYWHRRMRETLDRPEARDQ